MELKNFSAMSVCCCCVFSFSAAAAPSLVDINVVTPYDTQILLKVCILFHILNQLCVN